MAHYATELFIRCTYSLELSYDELLELEAELKLAVNALLERHEADFIHFEPLGDTMRVQCVFSNYDEQLFHSMCEGMAPHMDGRVEGRLLFVHKDLDTVHFYAVNNKKWRESRIALPPSGQQGQHDAMSGACGETA
ncbi:hypothetical protein LJC59_03525 [Desulfovibrio sp. OttesenSCG-928-A18]|nr:hypothetical protein [Desulfovibrio sp. OttesenSCG-928-A18]